VSQEIIQRPRTVVSIGIRGQSEGTGRIWQWLALATRWHGNFPGISVVIQSTAISLFTKQL
jgi:hypothetical protein